MEIAIARRLSCPGRIRGQSVAVAADRDLDHSLFDDHDLCRLGYVDGHDAAPVLSNRKTPVAGIGAAYDQDICLRPAHFLKRTRPVKMLRAFERAVDAPIERGLLTLPRLGTGKGAIVRGRAAAAEKQQRQRQQARLSRLHPPAFLSCERSRTAPRAALVVIAA